LNCRQGRTVRWTGFDDQTPNGKAAS